MIDVLVMTDGRDDCLARTIESLERQVSGKIGRRFIWDDTGHDRSLWFGRHFPDWVVVAHPEGRQGFGGAIRSAWSWWFAASTADHLFHVEDDFVFERPVDLDQLVDTLRLRPRLAQMALRRQPWNDAEKAAGGVVELHPEAFEDMVGAGGAHWLEHRLFFTSNVSVVPRRVVALGWPDWEHSEGVFTQRLRDLGYSFGYWGPRAGGTWVTHIGEERVGVGY